LRYSAIATSTPTITACTTVNARKILTPNRRKTESPLRTLDTSCRKEESMKLII
jgi:hypothetical protein